MTCLRTSLLRRALVACGASIALLAGCAGPASIAPDANGTIQELQSLANSVNLESAAWREQVDAAVRHLTDEGHQIIANDLSATVNGAIQAAGIESRCTADFFRARVRQDIEALIARLQGQDPAPPEPSICDVFPPTVDLNQAPNRIALPKVSGYDLQRRGSQARLLRLRAVDPQGVRHDATELLTVQSPYQATISLTQAQGCQLIQDGIKRLEIVSGGVLLAELPVLLPASVPQPAQGGSTTLTFHPGRDDGDKDFGTNPLGGVVSVNLRATARIEGNKVVADVFMDAREWDKNHDTPGGDKTRARGTSPTVTLYTAPAGMRLSRMITSRDDNPATYIQEGHDVRTVTGRTDLVQDYVVYTDHVGEDIGESDGDPVYTRVVVRFRGVKVELVPISPWCQ